MIAAPQVPRENRANPKHAGLEASLRSGRGRQPVQTLT